MDLAANEKAVHADFFNGKIIIFVLSIVSNKPVKEIKNLYSSGIFFFFTKLSPSLLEFDDLYDDEDLN